MKIFSNLAISLDGKIADPSLPQKMLGSLEDRRRMDVIRQMADVVIFGAGTLRATKKCVKIKKLKKNARQIANAVVSASGDLDPDWGFWDDSEVMRFVFTSAKGEARALKSCRDRAFVVVAGQDELDPEIIVRRLKESGFSRLLIEGGGETTALFFKKKLIQEVYLTLTPWIIGGRKSPTLVGGPNCLHPWLRLEKIKADWKQGDLFCHYKVKGARRL